MMRRADRAALTVACAMYCRGGPATAFFFVLLPATEFEKSVRHEHCNNNQAELRAAAYMRMKARCCGLHWAGTVQESVG